MRSLHDIDYVEACAKQPRHPTRFDQIPRSRVLELGRKGIATAIANANDFALSVEPEIRAAIQRTRPSFSAVAKLLNREHVPTARGGKWTSTSVRNVVLRIERLRGEVVLNSPYRFPTPRPRKGQVEVVPWEHRRPGVPTRTPPGFHWVRV